MFEPDRGVPTPRTVIDFFVLDRPQCRFVRHEGRVERFLFPAGRCERLAGKAEQAEYEPLAKEVASIHVVVVRVIRDEEVRTGFFARFGHACAFCRTSVI